MVDVQSAVEFSKLRGINFQNCFSGGDELVTAVGGSVYAVHLETIDLIVLRVEGDGNLLACRNGEVGVVVFFCFDGCAVHSHCGNNVFGAFVDIAELNTIGKTCGEVGFDVNLAAVHDIQAILLTLRFLNDVID